MGWLCLCLCGIRTEVDGDSDEKTGVVHGEKRKSQDGNISGEWAEGQMGAYVWITAFGREIATAESARISLCMGWGFSSGIGQWVVGDGANTANSIASPMFIWMASFLPLSILLLKEVY